MAEKGPIGEATMVANWTQYTEQFGGFVAGAYMAQAVYGYFNNGGNLCFVVRVGDESAGEVAAPPATASTRIEGERRAGDAEGVGARDRRGGDASAWKSRTARMTRST